MALSHLGLLGKICLQVLYSRWWLKPNLWWHSRTPQRSLQSFQTSQSIPSKGGSCRIGTTSNCFGIKHLRAWAYKVMCMSAHGSLLNLPVYRKSKESGKQKSRSSRMTPSSLSLSLSLSLYFSPPLSNNTWAHCCSTHKILHARFLFGAQHMHEFIFIRNGHWHGYSYRYPRVFPSPP